jgi:hypothetical protein
MLWEIQSTDLAQLKLQKDQEYKSKHQALFPENQSTNLCKPALKPLMVLYQSEEAKDNLLLVTDKLVKQPLLLILSSTKRQILIPEILKSNYIAFTLLLDKKDPLFLTSLKF